MSKPNQTKTFAFEFSEIQVILSLFNSPNSPGRNVFFAIYYVKRSENLHVIGSFWRVSFTVEFYRAIFPFRFGYVC